MTSVSLFPIVGKTSESCATDMTGVFGSSYGFVLLLEPPPKEFSSISKPNETTGLHDTAKLKNSKVIDMTPNRFILDFR